MDKHRINDLMDLAYPDWLLYQDQVNWEFPYFRFFNCMQVNKIGFKDNKDEYYEWKQS